MELICLLQNIDMCLLYKTHEITLLESHLIIQFSNLMFSVQQTNATKFGNKNEIVHIFYIIKWVLMAILQQVYAQSHSIWIVLCIWSNYTI